MDCLDAWRNASAHELGVPHRFSKNLSQDRERMGKGGEQARCGVFLMAVQCIRGLSCVHSPYEKVGVIREACDLMAKNGDALGADDMLPLLVFCFIQAEVPHLASELRYIEEMLMEDLADDEMGYFLACGNAALGRILALDGV